MAENDGRQNRDDEAPPKAASVQEQPPEVQGPDGQTYGQAGGYNTLPGQSEGGFSDGHAGQASGPTGGSGSGGGYTGQTGTGYGQTLGGEQEEPADHQEGLLDKARHLVSGVLGGNEDGGPQSYSRDDDRVRDDVNDRLVDDPFLDASHIEVSVERGHVTLSGAVTARPDKRRAQDLADDVSGVKQVHNNLRIEGASDSASEPAAMGVRVAELQQSLDRGHQTGSMSGNSVAGDPKPDR